MKCLTLRERESVRIGAGEALSESEAATFAQLQGLMPAGALSWEHRAIRFGPFCGILTIGNVVVELLPKIDRRSEGDADARGLLVAMLQSTGFLKVHQAGEAALGQQSMHLLDIFILDFCKRLDAELVHGSISSYQVQSDNLLALRGRLNLTEHLRINAFDRTRLFCSFDVRTVDNPHNRALKATLGKLLGLAVAFQAKASITTLLNRFDQVTLLPVTPESLDTLPFDRNNIRWRPVFERAKWLLQGLFPDVRVGDVDGVCLLFNMEQLFEHFVGVKVRQAWHAAGAGRFRVRLQGPQEFLAKEAQAFRLRPDVVIHDDQNCVVRILDSKWKQLVSSQANFGISTSDVHQLAVYAGRYGCRHVMLIYPASDDCRPGRVGQYALAIPDKPELEIHAVDVRALALGAPLSKELGPPIS